MRRNTNTCLRLTFWEQLESYALSYFLSPSNLQKVQWTWRMKFPRTGQWIPSYHPVPSAVTTLHPVTRAAFSVEPFKSLKQRLTCRGMVSEQKTHEKRLPSQWGSLNPCTQSYILALAVKSTRSWSAYWEPPMQAVVRWMPGIGWVFPSAFREAGAHTVSKWTTFARRWAQLVWSLCGEEEERIFLSLLANVPSSVSQKSFPKKNTN